MRTITTLLAAALLTACGDTPTSDEVQATQDVAPQARVVTVTTSSDEALAHFETGRTAFENVRRAEAAESFNMAVKADPEFATAYAYLSELTSGNGGLTLARKAVSLSADLPEAERLYIASVAAYREGDKARTSELRKQIAELAPDDWRAQSALGVDAFSNGAWEAALEPLERATELNPEAGAAWNMLGYTHANLGDYESAATALEMYVKASPDEPNPHDSLGEVLMMAGHLERADAAFTKATAVDEGFWVGHQGAAQARFLQGDWDGGMEALAKAKDTAPRAEDKLQVKVHMAWAKFAQGDTEGAMAKLDGFEEKAQEAGLDVFYADAALHRATMMDFAGDHEQALALTRECLARAEQAGLEGGPQKGLRRHAEAMALNAEAKLGRVEAAEQRLPFLEQAAEESPSMASTVHLARGTLALANGDVAGAITSLSKCDARDAYCALQLAQAQEQAGDAKAADITRERVRTMNHRWGAYLATWVRAGGLEALEGPGTAAVDD